MTQTQKNIVIIVLIILCFLLLLLVRFWPMVRIWMASDKVEIVENIAYVQDNLPSHRLDLYLPKGKKGFPVVHFLYGGYWIKGNKNYYQFVTGLYANVGVALAKEGIGVVIPNYGIVPEISFEEQVQDTIQGIQWTHQHIREYGGNPDALFLSGHSAGGHLISLVGLDPAYRSQLNIPENSIKGYITLSGIFDLVDLKNQNDESLNQEVTYTVFGKAEENLHKDSPLTYFGPGIKPFLMFVGENDFPYLLTQTPNIAQRLEELGNKVEIASIRGYSHQDMVLRFNSPEDQITSMIVSFIQKLSQE